MLAAFIVAYERLILARPLLSLLVCLSLVAALASQLGNLKLDASADSLVLEGDKDLEYYREISALYESEDFVVVTFQPRGDLLGDESLQTIAELRDELAGLDGVSSVTTLLDVPLLESPPVELSDITGGKVLPDLMTPGVDKELARQEFRDSPIYRDLLVSADGRTAAIQVNLERDQRYEELLREREALRADKAAGELSADGRQALRDAEQAFKDYNAVVLERQGQFIDRLRGIEGKYRDRADLFIGGVPMIAVDMITFVENDLVTFGIGILLFTVVILALIFRGLRWVFLPLFCCVVTTVFMLGLLSWLDWRMTVISSNFVALLLIITLSLSIHLVVRFRELELDNPDAPQRELVLEMVRLMSVPCLYTALTTAVAFVSLVVSGIRPVIDFGWMMTSGIAAALLLTFVILPCSLALMPRGKAGDASLRHIGLTVHFARFTERFAGWIIPGSLVLAAVSLWGISRLEVENRFIDYFHENTEIYQGMELLDSKLGGTVPLDIILDLDPAEADPVIAEESPEALAYTPTAAYEDWEGAEEDTLGDDEWGDDDFDSGFDDVPAGEGESFHQSYWFTVRGMARLESIHEYVDSLPETGKVLSLSTTFELVKSLLGENLSDVELALVQKSLPDEIRELMVDPYFSEDIEQARIALRVKETSRDLRRNEFLQNLHAHLVDELGVKEEQLHFTGMLVMYNNMLQSLFRSQILTLGAVFIAIMLMFIILFRSFWLALIAVIPNILAAGVVLGGMGLVGIPLDMMTITIAAIVVGIGVDDTIHYVHRFRVEFAKDRNYLATMYRCHESIGRAMFYTSVTIVLGFSILALSNFNPTIHFGLLTGLAMIVAVLGALILLPQLLRSFKPLGPEGSE